MIPKKRDYSRVKTLKISIETHERLTKRGRIDETYGDVINRLLDMADDLEARTKVKK